MNSRLKDAHIKTDSYDVHIYRNYDSDSTDVYVLDKRHGKRSVLYPGPDGGLLRHDLVEGSNVQRFPFVRFQGMDSDLIFAVAEAFAEAVVDRPTDSKIQGLYEAQSRHLEDMRTLVFKDRHEG